MNIILLSGGSGKRLWPLSDEIRPKQFIKLFKNEKDEYESMLQRVFRQIKTVDPQVQVTIATSKNQVPTIYNQLGNRVSVCIEPMRRDTFPAIALVVAYLKYEKKVQDNEVIAICPVDPYVDDTYFDAVMKLDSIVSTCSENLTLMGIEPLYASEKYGYIIPENCFDISPVKSFKEKPDKASAEVYLKNGALWNAGVFAFKLSYMLNLVHGIVDFTDYKDLYSKYDQLPKISFDYMVVEKESSIQVMRYKGKWKDIGTWNMLSEVMPYTIKGSVILDDVCENTNVINELNIPMLVMGTKDMMVVASENGILISNKERSDCMKFYLDEVEKESQFTKNSYGSYNVIDSGTSFVIAKIDLEPGNSISYLNYKYKNAVWTILEGTGCATVDGEEKSVSTGGVIPMTANCNRTIVAWTKMTILETQFDAKSV